jgi:NAD(P)-dependent dehydrogenase (short-subunit alcohol dehydrogenase family)
MPSPLSPTAVLRARPLSGRVAWITGAGRGLGRAVAVAFADAGADLLITARDADRLASLRDELAHTGAAVEIVAGSVTEAGDVSAAVDRAGERWGRIDVLVNNAGISPTYAFAEDVPFDRWHEVLAVNVEGSTRCAVAALPLLEAAGRGANVVNVSSVHGTVAAPRLAPYATSKGAVEALTRSLAIEWASRGIRVNAIAPGYIETDMTAGLRANDRRREELLARTPLGRFATAAEIAASILFLASPAAGYVTGATLLADGGWSAW